MRLIDADALLKASTHQVWNAPTIEAEPIRHGHWEHGKDVIGIYYQCSECGSQYHIGYEFNYCPECGAKMDAPTQKSVAKALETEEQT